MDVSKQVLATVVPEQPPVRWRELIALVGVIALCDATIYRGQGFAGAASFFAAMPLLLALGSPRPRFGWSFWITGAMLLALSVKLAWCGSVLQIVAGVGLLAAFAAAISGACPHVLETLVLASLTISAGYGGLTHYERCLRRRLLNPDKASRRRSAWLSFVLPLATCAVFALVFICANPDLAKLLGASLQDALDAMRQWLLHWSPNVVEILVWIAALWLGVGLLRPNAATTTRDDAADHPIAMAEADAYPAIRNTLATVIVLFAVYLAFEFNTLWFRVFPEGFYYSGYAHDGAAWLTVALILATLVLSVFFRGGVLCDPRLPKLRRWAWIWSLENLVLAMAVYHRLFIYVGFNGMTRMRMVGLFGISAVVVGFVLVVWKITHNRRFLWLVQRQLWTLALAVYLFALTPVDAVVIRYNVHRIMAGDPAPSVQISVHPIDSEGVAHLLPLTHCDDAVIREGVAAMLANRQTKLRVLDLVRQAQGWTAFQGADRNALEMLDANDAAWSTYAKSPAQAGEALARFRNYAYQWY
jgi:hypothetical protein